MLAASLPVSNVPPDNLQAPPVVAYSTRSPQQLGEHRPVLPPHTNPGPAAQQYAARQKPRPDPFVTTAAHPDFTITEDPEGPAIRPSSPDTPQFPNRGHAPGQCCRHACTKGQRQSGYGCNTGDDQHDAGPGDTATQERVRLEFGKVCVRWHARSVPTMGLVAATGTH